MSVFHFGKASRSVGRVIIVFACYWKIYIYIFF